MTDSVLDSKFGFVSFIGKPNAGKSTLVNILVGEKVSIVSPKEQTTRSRLLGIFIEGRSQVALVDVPGIFKPRRELDKAMVYTAWQSSQNSDVVAYIFDASSKKFDDDLLSNLKNIDQKKILVINKIDLVSKHRLLEISQKLNDYGLFDETFMVSASNGDGVEDLKKYLVNNVPDGVWLYPEDQLTDIPVRLLASETTREKLFLGLYQELPYSCAVETDVYEEVSKNSVKIIQTIYVLKESQRPIVLGKDGSKIKSVRMQSQSEISKFLGKKVHLFLHVKVKDDWQDDKSLWFGLERPGT